MLAFDPLTPRPDLFSDYTTAFPFLREIRRVFGRASTPNFPHFNARIRTAHHYR
jgi:hypothetical protein